MAGCTIVPTAEYANWFSVVIQLAAGISGTENSKKEEFQHACAWIQSPEWNSFHIFAFQSGSE
jgi:hypothetical protein